MFNDDWLLTQDVIEGRKTQARYIIPPEFFTLMWDTRDDTLVYENDFGDFIDIRKSKYARYKVGEVVAVAQRYQDIFDKSNCVNPYDWEEMENPSRSGWGSKALVKADLMPSCIRITKVRVERLQDISDEDCIKEGIVFVNTKCASKATGIRQDFYPCRYMKQRADKSFWGICYDTPRNAFARLAYRLYGCNAWESNPYVFVYEFELVK